MENDIDKIFSDAFQKKIIPEDEAIFTAKLMSKLPHKGIPTQTRIGILFACTTIALILPFLNGGYEDFFAWSEEFMIDAFISFQYWVEELGLTA